MAGLSQYQTVFRVVKHDNANQSRLTMRNRQQLSCVTCRSNKLRCDRQLPCAACSRKGAAKSCTYNTNGRSERGRPGTATNAFEAQTRLQNLEEMVTGLVAASNGIPKNRQLSQSETVDQGLKGLRIDSSQGLNATASGGYLDIDGTETKYVGATHWATILENIRDIQAVLGPDVEDSEITMPEHPSDGPEIVIDTSRSLTLTDVMQSLPLKADADKLLSSYLNSRNAHLPVLHTGKFLREYDLFWSDPSSASYLWISILFSALYLGQLNLNDSLEKPYPSELPSDDHLFVKAGQALVTGRYHEARPHAVEAVLFYANCKYFQKQGADADAWLYMGITARLALRMGYHRDPRHFVHLSPFEGEMRRRTFMVIETFDLLVSFLSGLPAVINGEDVDTDGPSNLFDTDFDEDCTSLPPSRPWTHPTPMLYYCYKSGLARTFGRIVRHALHPSTDQSHFTQTMKLDSELNRLRLEKPPSLRMRPIDSSVTDHAQTVINELNLEIQHLQCVCILHRYYLSHERSNPTFDYSRQACTNAALQLLKYQAEMHTACQPGGRFHGNKTVDLWQQSRFIVHDFLLAAMINALDLYESRHMDAAPDSAGYVARVEKYDALTLSHDIWQSRRSLSRDVRRASNVLAVMLSKVPRPRKNIVQNLDNGPERATTGSGSNATNVSSGYGPTDDGVERASASMNSDDFLNSMFSEPGSLDWGLLDQYLLPQSNDNDPLFNWEPLNNASLPQVT